MTASLELDLLAGRTHHTLADDVMRHPQSGYVTMFLVLQTDGPITVQLFVVQLFSADDAPG